MKNNIEIFKNKVIKYVDKNEAAGYLKVYPSINQNSLLLERPTAVKDGYKVTMKRLESFPLSSKIKVSQYALNMLNRQLNRLHKSGRVHSNLNAKEQKLKQISKKIDIFRSLKRQLLVEYNNNKVISKIYLTNFDVRKTNNTFRNERNFVDKFILHMSELNNNNTKRNAMKLTSISRSLF